MAYQRYWRRKPRYSVTFAERIPSKLICVEDRASLSQQERDAIWYNAEEINKLQKQVKKIILNKEAAAGAEEHTDRGLEYHVASHGREMAEKEGKPDAFHQNKQTILAAAQENLKQQKQYGRTGSFRNLLQQQQPTTTGTSSRSLRNLLSSAPTTPTTDIESLSRELNQEALLQSDMLAAQDTAEAYNIYLETMDPDVVNKCFDHGAGEVWC